MNQSPDFDSKKQINPYGEEYWSARDLMPLLGYGKNWQNFTTAIEKAMVSCSENGQIVEYHFNAVIKMVPIGSGAQRKQDVVHPDGFSGATLGEEVQAPAK